MQVWIDQDLCTGDGICEEICPDVFVARSDGLWVVKEEKKHFGTSVIFDLAPERNETIAHALQWKVHTHIRSRAPEERPGFQMR